MYKKIQTDFGTLEIFKFQHDTIVFKSSATIMFDPFKLQDSDLIPVGFIDAIFISHPHFDHFSPEDIKLVIRDITTLIFPVTMQEIINKKFPQHNSRYLFPVEPLKKYSISLNGQNISFMTLPAYNIDKVNKEGKPFHSQDSGFVSYFLNINDTSVFFAGDSDFIPELKALKDLVQIVCIPISGTYVMDMDEAIKFVQYVKPKIVIPMHYGTIVGDKNLGIQFKEKLSKLDSKIEVIL